MTPLAPLLTAFLRERLAIERGASPNTCDAYAFSFKLFLEFASKQLRKRPSALPLEALDAKLVLAFLKHVEQKRGCSASTRNARLSAIRSFMRYVEYRVPTALKQVRRVLLIPTKKMDRQVIEHLSSAEIEALLNAPDLSTRLGIRDRAMIHLAYAAGLRVTELVTLPRSSVILSGTASIHVTGKGRRQRALPIWKAARDDVRAWIAVRGDVTGPELFLNARGGPMTRSGFEYVLEKHATKAMITCPSLKQRRLSPHVLRHTCAMMILQATGDIRKVALWLGHSELKTTEMYLRSSSDEKLAVLGKLRTPILQRGQFRPQDRLIASLME